MIQEKTTEDLRRMTDEEGLILQGCGGDLQEWVDGINDLLTQEGILLNGTKFEHAATFQHDGLTNLLFSFEGVQLWESLRCGGFRRTVSLAALGCLTMYPTGWVVSWISRTSRRDRNRTVR